MEQMYYYAGSHQIISEIMPKEHIKWIAEQLNCKQKEVVVLAIQPDAYEYDEEGWNITSFFPEMVEVKSTLLAACKVYKDLQVNNIQRIQANGIMYIGDQDACPWTIYAKFENTMIKV